jgi:hypothetical protein
MSFNKIDRRSEVPTQIQEIVISQIFHSIFKTESMKRQNFMRISVISTTKQFVKIILELTDFTLETSVSYFDRHFTRLSNFVRILKLFEGIVKVVPHTR